MDEKQEEEMWAEEDKYAIYRMKHVMGTKDYPSGVSVTKNWTESGLTQALNRHLKIALNGTRKNRFYQKMQSDQELWVVEKLVSYPTLKDCVEHLAMIYRWEKHRPVLLVPDAQAKQVMRLVSM
jgi:hypothetical protein